MGLVRRSLRRESDQFARRFELPEVLAARLSLLVILLYRRDEAPANGFSYDNLIQEMDEALAALDPELTAVASASPGDAGSILKHRSGTTSSSRDHVSCAQGLMEAPPTYVLRLSSTSVEEGEIQIPEVTEPAPTMEGPTTFIPEANFTIQVAAFREYQDAVSLSTLLQDYGHPSYVVETEIQDACYYYRVRVGHFETADKALDSGLFLGAQFSDVLPDPWIVPYQD